MSNEVELDIENRIAKVEERLQAFGQALLIQCEEIKRLEQRFNRIEELEEIG